MKCCFFISLRAKLVFPIPELPDKMQAAGWCHFALWMIFPKIRDNLKLKNYKNTCYISHFSIESAMNVMQRDGSSGREISLLRILKSLSETSKFIVSWSEQEYFKLIFDPDLMPSKAARRFWCPSIGFLTWTVPCR